MFRVGSGADREGGGGLIWGRRLSCGVSDSSKEFLK